MQDMNVDKLFKIAKLNQKGELRNSLRGWT
jgi:hypothetical protein